MASNARIGNGTLLGVGDGGSPESFTTLAERVSITSSIEADMIDVSHMDTTRWRDFASGLVGMTLSVEGNYLPTDPSQNYADAGGLIRRLVEGETANWQLIFPTSPAVTWLLPAKVASVEHDLPNDDKMSFAAELQISGAPTLE